MEKEGNDGHQAASESTGHRPPLAQDPGGPSLILLASQRMFS